MIDIREHIFSVDTSLDIQYFDMELPYGFHMGHIDATADNTTPSVMTLHCFVLGNANNPKHKEQVALVKTNVKLDEMFAKDDFYRYFATLFPLQFHVFMKRSAAEASEALKKEHMLKQLAAQQQQAKDVPRIQTARILPKGG